MWMAVLGEQGRQLVTRQVLTWQLVVHLVVGQQLARIKETQVWGVCRCLLQLAACDDNGLADVGMHVLLDVRQFAANSNFPLGDAQVQVALIRDLGLQRDVRLVVLRRSKKKWRLWPWKCK